MLHRCHIRVARIHFPQLRLEAACLKLLLEKLLRLLRISCGRAHRRESNQFGEQREQFVLPFFYLLLKLFNK
ncbi:hypothetical protein D3C84_945040 [compost metagenome]